jgi:hypothetical protein
MSFVVCPSSFMRLAVAMWPSSFTSLAARTLVPLARDDARLTAVGSSDAARARQSGVISKHPGPGTAWTAGIRSAQVAESDFLVSPAESDFPRI